jgi:glycosyltransferase involved in cell wall biosynthesis
VKILLVANYRPDRQPSMLGFASLMEQGLKNAGHRVQKAHPPVVFGRLARWLPVASKWLGYLDKFVLFPPLLRQAARDADIVHICDHSYAMYARKGRRIPYVVTCHDLLAVRGGFGEQTDCPASPFGRILQRWIVRGLRRADGVACDSTATLVDATRFLSASGRALELLPLALRYDYKPLSESERGERLKAVSGLDPNKPFVLHVGSSQRRKNREGVLRVFARIADKVDAQLVFAGKFLEPAQRQLAAQLKVLDRIVETGEISNELLIALYGGALVFFFPSRFEGFGWPIIEAQSCGCPVVCSDGGPFPEVAGDSALMRDVEDEGGFAADIVRLATDANLRAVVTQKGLQNTLRYRPEQMISKYVAFYERVLASARELAPDARSAVLQQ